MATLDRPEPCRGPRANQSLLSIPMSATDHSVDDSPYPRENFWGQIALEDDTTAVGHTELPGTDKWEYVAWSFLMNTATPICGRTGTELSEPQLHLPKLFEGDSRSIEYGQHRHRRRVNPDTGYINWGETTSTELRARPKDEFMDVVDCVLDWADETGQFTVGIDHRDRVRTLALRRKEAGNHDVQILATAMRCIEDHERLTDHGF